MSKMLIATFFLASLWQPSAAQQSSDPPPKGGFLYTMTNAPKGNGVIVIQTSAEGAFSLIGEVPTGGLGTGTPLENQGALAVSEDGHMLLVVNPGSDDLSVFALGDDGIPKLQDVVPVRGRKPISVAMHRDRVYVLNAGGTLGAVDTIVGFDLSADRTLSFVPGSMQSLSAPSTDPAQVGFSPDGRLLVVTEKDTDRIDLFMLNAAGVPVGGSSIPSIGTEPFGFAFDSHGRLYVSEAFDGAPDQGALTSYFMTSPGFMMPVDTATTTETSTCWVAVKRDGRFVYTTNTGSDSVTGFAVSEDGGLKRLDPDGVTARTSRMPLDVALSRDERFLYTLDAGSGLITAFRVLEDGGLVGVSERESTNNLFREAPPGVEKEGSGPVGNSYLEAPPKTGVSESPEGTFYLEAPDKVEVSESPKGNLYLEAPAKGEVDESPLDDFFFLAPPKVPAGGDPPPLPLNRFMIFIGAGSSGLVAR